MICEHGNEVSPEHAKALCRMPDSFYRRVAPTLDPEVCIFLTEASALSEQALMFKRKVKLASKAS